MVQEAGAALWRKLQLHDEEIRALKSQIASTHVGSRLAPTVVTGVIPPSSGGTGYALQGSPLGVTVWLSPAATTQYSVVVSGSSRTYGTSTSQGIETVIGVNDDAAAGAGENIRVRNIGYQPSVRVTGAVTAGHYLRQSTSAGVAESAGAVQTSGVFARALSANAGPGAGNVEAYLFPPVPQSVYFSGHIRVGSLIAPSNTTAGDLGATRINVGADGAIPNVASLYALRNSHVPTVAANTLGQTTITYAPNGTSAGNTRDVLTLQNFIQPTANDNGIFRGFNILVSHNAGAFNLTAASTSLVAVAAFARQATAASTVTEAVVFLANPQVSAGTVTTLTGMDSIHSTVGGSGTVTTLSHYRARVSGTPATITTHLGIHIGNLGHANVTTAVGVEIDAQTGATTNFGIRNAGNSVQTGYARFGAVTAPANVTNGDVTAIRLRVSGASADAALGTDMTVQIRGAMTATSGSVNWGLFNPVISPASNSTAAHNVLTVEPLIAPSAGVTLTTVLGLNFSLTHQQDSTLTNATAGLLVPLNLSASVAVGAITNAIGLQIRPYARFAGTGSVTVTNLYGINLLGPTHAGATITTYRSLYIEAPSASTITTHVAIEIASLTQATTNIGIRNASTMRQIGSAMFGVDATATALVHIQQPLASLGAEVFRVESLATNDDPSVRHFQNRVTTTDATVTTLHSYTVPASTTAMLVARVVARRTGGTAGTAEDAASFLIHATVKNVAGTATQVGLSPTVVSSHFEAGNVWTATIDVSGGDARVRVTGALDNNITWHLASFEVSPVST